MRNLKRALSLALAAAMLIGMMVISASAVSYNDLTDKDEIVNKDAVTMLVALDIIQGKPDGSYAPAENVDRAQMAKMISVIMNKGVDNAALYENVDSKLTDIDGNWAKGHINYCYTNGVIAGRGNNTFAPSDTVTALEAAKMLLVAIGYDPSIEGFIGTDWALSVSSTADSVGIFRNFTKDLTAPLNRDDAALLIYNALDVEMIQQYSNGYALTYADHRTILSDKYGVIRVEGVVTANEWAILDDDSDTALKEGLTRIENADGIFSTTTNTQVINEADNTRTGTFEVSTPVEFLGQSVTMYIKKDTILSNSVVYGDPVPTSDNNIVTTGDRVTGGTTRDDDSLASLLKGTGLAADKNTEYYLNYAEVAKDNTDPLDPMNVKGATLTVIDNDNDGYVDYVLSLQKTLSEISTYNTKKESLTVKGMITEDFANVVGYEDVAEDDIVLAVCYGGRTYVEIPETVTGEMEYYTTKNVDNKYMTVDGTDYYEDDLKVETSSVIKFKVDECEDGGVDFNASYIFYLDDYDNVVAFEETEAAEKNYALITDSAFSVNGLRLTGDVTLLLADGTKGTYAVNWKATRNNLFTDDTAGDEALKDFLGTDDGRVQDGSTKYNPAGNAKGILVTYSMNEAGDEVTLDAPSLNIASHTKSDDLLITSYDKSNYASTNVGMLDEALENGDTYFETKITAYVWSYRDANRNVVEDSVTCTAGSRFGIDDETVVFYYDGDNANVAIGYDNLYNTLGADGEVGLNGHKLDVVMYNPEAYPDSKRGVANVMLVTGDYEAEKDTNYALILDTYRNYDDYSLYNAILEDGTITTLKVEGYKVLEGMDGVNKMVYEYSTDADGWTEVKSVFDNGTKDNKYLIVDGRTDRVVDDVLSDNNITFGYVYVPYARWVETYHYDIDNVNVHWDEMLGDRNPDVIWNAFDVDLDADTADTIEFENGQQAVIVYDSNMRVEAAWVIADVEDDIELPDAPTGDLITKTLINGTVNSACADTYTTVARAVENATPIRVSFFQAASLNVQLTKDNTETMGAWWAHYASSTEARAADPDAITNGWGGYTTSGNFGTGAVTGTSALTDTTPMDNGNIILVKVETAPLEYVYAAYEIVVTGI